MDNSRLFTRLLMRIDRMLQRLNVLLSVVYIAIVVSLFSIILYMYVTLLYPLIRTTFQHRYAVLHTVFSLYLIFATATNYVACMLISPGVPPRAPDPELDPEPHLMCEKRVDSDVVRTRSEIWRFCAVCRAPKPPRVHHCSACGSCYYRLCHHCPALGKCVGRDNYPFFFRFVQSAFVGSVFTGATCARLRRGSLPAHANDSLFFLMIAACAVGVSVGVLAVWYIFLLTTGQTTIEWLENLHMRRRGAVPHEWGAWGGAFNKGFRANMQDAFGTFQTRAIPTWLLLFVPLRRMNATDVY